MRRCLITGTVTFSDDATNTGSVYVGGNTITGNSTFTSNAAAIWYEAYQGADIYTGNTSFIINGTGTGYTSYNFPSSFTGNLTITRSGIGATNIFNNGFAALTGNFSYINNAGGATSINTGNKYSPAIGGKVDITATGTGNPSFEMNKIKNLTTGGTISVQNSGLVTINDDTLTVTALNVNGFTGGGGDGFMRNSITGNVTFSDDAANTGSTYVGGNIIAGNASFTSNSANIWYESYQGSDIYNGNVSFSRTAGTVYLAYNDTTNFNGDLILNTATGIIYNNALQFGGSTNAIIEQLGTQSVILPKLIMNKTGGATLTLNDSLIISTSANFTNGNIISSSANPLSFLDDALQTGASDASHVIGTVSKTGNELFTFPVGSATTYNPVSMTAPAAGSVFSAAYFLASPNSVGDTSQKDPTLKRISNCEYWDVKRVNGTSNVSLTFAFGDPCSGNPIVYISDPSKIHIAHWTGSTWEDLGNGGSTGTTSGTITTAGAVSNFSPFTFASTDVIANPLPLRLIRFAATRQLQKVVLSWSTENEKNFSHFEIEKSKGDNNFESIGIINANNNPAIHEYAFQDETPNKGINFYRLKLVDIDGDFKYSKIEPILFSNKSAITVYPNPAKNEIRILSSKKIISIEITDVLGKLVKRITVNTDNRYNINDLQQGIHFIKITDEEKATVTKLLVQ